MKENLTATWITLALIAVFVIGNFAGANLFPKQVEVIKNITIPGETEYVYVNSTVEVPAPSQLDRAAVTFMKAVENEEDEAGNEIDLLEGYDSDEVVINKLYDEYNVSYDGDKTIVDFKVRLKYDEKGDSERSEKETYSVRVTYEEDEDSEVTYERL